MYTLYVQVKGKMQQNIGALMERGVHLNELEGKAGVSSVLKGGYSDSNCYLS